MAEYTLPNFFIIGAGKSGTTYLWSILRQHPKVYMPQLKEPNFFSNGWNWSKGWEWYTKLYEGIGNEIAVGEASTTYSQVAVWPEACARLARFFPDARLLYIVRHPVDRIESHWKQAMSMDDWWILKCKDGIDRTVPVDPNKMVREYPPVLENSLYWKNISYYREYFSDDQLKILFFRNLTSNPQSVINECLEFLDLIPIGGMEDMQRPRKNSSKKKTMIPVWLGKFFLYPVMRVCDLCFPLRFRKMFRGKVRGVAKNKPVPQNIPWNWITLKWMVEKLRPDSEKLLKYCGKKSDFWDFNLHERLRQQK